MIRVELLPPHFQAVEWARARARELGKKVGPHAYSVDEIKAGAESCMARIDELPADIRAVVHEEGWVLVRRALEHGFKTPGSISAFIASEKLRVYSRFMELNL